MSTINMLAELAGKATQGKRRNKPMTTKKTVRLKHTEIMRVVTWMN